MLLTIRQFGALLHIRRCKCVILEVCVRIRSLRSHSREIDAIDNTAFRRSAAYSQVQMRNIRSLC